MTSALLAFAGCVIVLCLSLISGAAFGYQAIGRTLFNEISVETSPPGKSETVTVLDVPKHVSFSGSHSMIYESPQVIEDIQRRLTA